MSPHTMSPPKSREVQPSKAAPPAQQPAPQVKPGPKDQVSNAQPPTKQPTQVPYSKKVPRRSSKPIINWFQRKLAGTVKTRRVSDGSPVLAPVAEVGSGRKSRNGTALPVKTRSTRSVSSPWPQPSRVSSQRNGVGNSGGALSQSRRDDIHLQRKTISLNGDGDFDEHSEIERDVETSTHHSSLARDSMWSPTSPLEADEDASVRPLPPSAPPSPSPSHSSSSYMSDPRTFRSIAASTKPTTLLSIDMAPAGIGHIAQVPVTPVSQIAPRFPPHVRSSSTGTSGGHVGSGASITFSALPPSPQSSSRPSSFMNQTNAGSSSPGGGGPSSNSNNMNGVQAPLHTAHHPRNNPRPSSPPMDNASVLTLASSAYAIPGARLTLGSVGSAALFAMGVGDSVSQLGGSMAGDGEGENSSHFLLADDDRLDVYGDRDVDASLRALRPRSSRRGSWESEASGWSARILGAGAGLSMGSKSLWTSNSVRTNGLLSVENEEKEAAEEPKDEDNRNSSSNSRNNSVKVPSPNTRLAGGDVSPTKPQVTDVEKMVLDEASAPEIVAIAPPLEQREESTETTETKVPPVSEQEQSQQSVESKQDDRQDADDESHPSTSYRSPSSSYDSGRTASDGDLHSLAATNRTETWQSALSIPAPSTPVG